MSPRISTTKGTYVDDYFSVFDDRSHIDRFMTYPNVNSQQPKIRFTKEVKSNGCMPFLDHNFHRQNNRLEISIFCKATGFTGFTGLGLSFFSFIPSTVKKLVLVSAVTRAFRLTSSYKLFDCELNFLNPRPAGGPKGPLWFFANSSWSTENFALKLAIPLRATIPHLVSKN